MGQIFCLDSKKPPPGLEFKGNVPQPPKQLSKKEKKELEERQNKLGKEGDGTSDVLNKQQNSIESLENKQEKLQAEIKTLKQSAL